MRFAKGPPSRISRVLQLVVCAGIILFIYHALLTAQVGRYPSDVSNVELEVVDGVSAEEQYLERLANEADLSKEAMWTAWRVRPTESSYSWQSVTPVHARFQSSYPLRLNIATAKNEDIRAKKRIDLSVPQSPLPGTVDASDLIFGITTTYDRLQANDFAMIKAWSRWLTNGRFGSNGASLVLMLDRADTELVSQIDKRLSKAGIDSYVTTTQTALSLARRYYELARILNNFSVNLVANGQNKRWFALVEDTVFFPSLSYLLDRLYAFNSDKKLYVGLPSEKEDWEVLGDHTITTYGGGALFFTRSSLAEIPKLPCFSRRSESNLPVRAKNWGVLIQDCITSNTELNMHVLPGFYSPNDETYFANMEAYESGVQPLLLHRAQERHGLDVSKAHLVANICGESCFMQKYLFQDNWILVNGVSLSQIPTGVQFKAGNAPPEPEEDEDELNEFGTHDIKPKPKAKTAKTKTAKRVIIEEEVMDNDHTVMTWKGEKKTWRLMDSAVGKNGAVWQGYVKKGNPKAVFEEDRIDSAMVLIWETHGMVSKRS